VCYIRAGDRLLERLADALPQRTWGVIHEAWVSRCNVDYDANTTWGSHESYLCTSTHQRIVPHLLPHLVTRILYTGAGGFDPRSHGLVFSISPRVGFLEHVLSGSSTNGRGIVHTKDEALCKGYSRLHLLCGESLCSDTGAWLRAATTALIVKMIDAGLEPGSGLELSSPLLSMRILAADTTLQSRISTASGFMTALAVQRCYLEQAEANLDAPCMPAWAETACRRWRRILDSLEHDPASLAGALDWMIKQSLYKRQAAEWGIDWEALSTWHMLLNFVGSALEDLSPSRANAGLRAWREILSRDDRKLLKQALGRRLEKHGMRLEMLPSVLEFRQRIHEIDKCFGQLGERGIFNALDRAGVLNHRIPEVDLGEEPLRRPPPEGRARIRGEVIRRFSRRPAGEVACSWSSITDKAASKRLDLSDPFASEEKWIKIEQAVE